jgi:hypothetical protein
MTTARAVRAATCLLSAILVTTWTGTAAMAHGRSLPDSSHYRSTVTAVEPSVPGLVLTVTKAGESLSLTNHAGKMVVVIGYAGEDYLRITSTGVDENIASLSSSLNGSLIIEGLPQPQEHQQHPQWRHVSNQPTFTWHDHRIHWPNSDLPSSRQIRTMHTRSSTGRSRSGSTENRSRWKASWTGKASPPSARS